VADGPRLISDRAARRIAVISMHTSPTASLGQNGNGGLNVYVREVATAFSERGIATDIFTRRQTPDEPTIERLAALSRVIYLPAGRGLDKYSLYDEVPGFAARIAQFAEREGITYDLLFSHYWLSFADLMRDPVYWDDLVKNLEIQALYAAVFGSAAWARFTAKDITA